MAGSLPAALRASVTKPRSVIPRYGTIDLKGMRRVYERCPSPGATRYDCSIYQAPAISVYLLDCPPLYGRKGIYGESGWITRITTFASRY